MADLFLDPKVLDYSDDKYQLILYSLRWARAMKAKGSPTPMNELIEKALRDLVEGKITKEEIMANKLAVSQEPKPEVPAVVSVADEDEAGAAKKAKLAENGEDE